MSNNRGHLCRALQTMGHCDSDPRRLNYDLHPHGHLLLTHSFLERIFDSVLL